MESRSVIPAFIGSRGAAVRQRARGPWTSVGERRRPAIPGKKEPGEVVHAQSRGPAARGRDKESGDGRRDEVGKARVARRQARRQAGRQAGANASFGRRAQLLFDHSLFVSPAFVIISIITPCPLSLLLLIEYSSAH